MTTELLHLKPPLVPFGSKADAPGLYNETDTSASPANSTADIRDEEINTRGAVSPRGRRHGGTSSRTGQVAAAEGQHAIAVTGRHGVGPQRAVSDEAGAHLGIT